MKYVKFTSKGLTAGTVSICKLNVTVTVGAMLPF